jgi:alcohol dehydrogenase class IV
MTTDSKGSAPAGQPVGPGADVSVPAWPGFSIARLPRILFGGGRSGELGSVVREFGQNALLIVRGPDFANSPEWLRLLVALESADVAATVESVSGEPSPALVDEIVARHRGGPTPIDVVVGIGGGSVMDTAKAVAGLLIPGNSVMDHLEGVGRELPYRGPSVPFIAVPTTAGTGSEATKNAVLSVRGAGGFKKSFRDEALVARVAIVDPVLLSSCPPELIAGNGMDTLSQLLESYVSLKANPFTDALALSGLACVRDGLLAWFEEAAAGRGADGPGSVAAAARERMAYAALCSGICLAQAGLGSVHGLASPLGAQFPIPHGVACGATLAAATAINIAALETRDPESVALSRYAAAGWILSGIAGASDREARSALIAFLEYLPVRLNVPRLSAFGVTASSILPLVADSRGSSMKTNPIELTDEEIGAVVRASL